MPFNTLMEPEVCIQNLLIVRINLSVHWDNEQFSGKWCSHHRQPGKQIGQLCPSEKMILNCFAELITVFFSVRQNYSDQLETKTKPWCCLCNWFTPGKDLFGKKGLTLIKSGKDPECISYQAERKDALEDVKQACSVIEHSNVNHIR